MFHQNQFRTSLFSSKQWKFLLIIVVFFIQFETSKSINNTNMFLNTVSNWATRRTFTEPTKRLFFPKGSKLTLDPSLELPVINPDVLGVGSTFKMSFPVTIKLDRLSLRPLQDIIDPNGHWELFSIKDLSNLHSRYRRSDDKKSSAQINGTLSSCAILLNQRFQIYQKFEGFYDSYRLGRKSGKSCLLKTICEIHEYPMTEELGILGEFVTHLFSSKELSSRCKMEPKPLREYTEAEKHGRNGNCAKYRNLCNFSLFV